MKTLRRSPITTSAWARTGKMAYCPSCGSKVDDSAQFCSDCGEPIGTAENDANAVAESDDATFEETEGLDWSLLAVSVVMGLLAGGFAAWATANMGISSVAFLVVLAGTSYFLYQKRIPSEAVGSGLYITALIMVLTPLLFYIPTVLGANEGTPEGAGQFVGSILGLIIWGFVFVLFAIVTAAIGYFFKRRASKKLG